MALLDQFQDIRQHVVDQFFPATWHFDIAPVILAGNLLCGEVFITHDLLSELVVIDQRKFQEMGSTLHCDGLNVGSGYIKKRSFWSGNGMERTATS